MSNSGTLSNVQWFGFLDYKKCQSNVVWKCPQTHDFPPKLIFSFSLIFFEKYLDMMFNNTQHGKKGFLDYKNVILT